MKSVLLSLLILTLSSCSWFDAPRGNKNLQGSFIYYDFDPSAFSENQATISFLFKTGNKSFIGSVPVKNLVSSFYDKQSSIPFKGDFEAVITYDQFGRIDQFRLMSLEGSPVNLTIKAKDHN